MKVPTEFKIFNQTIRIVWRPDLMKKNNQLGCAELNNNIIVLQEPNNDVCLESIEQVFWHEVVHHVLYKAGYERLAYNEKLVDIVGSIMCQVFNSIIENINSQKV